jgi:hypothetical protein
LTAGHCEAEERQVYVADHKVGKITANSFRGEQRVAADALRFRIPRLQRSARLATQAHGDVPVIGKLPNRALVRGQFLCFLGRTTGAGCGYLVRSDIALRLGDTVFTHLWCARIPMRPGDSGGPVVQLRGNGAVRAVGLGTLSLWTASSDEMCFSSIDHVLNQLDVRLVSAER